MRVHVPIRWTRLRLGCAIKTAAADQAPHPYQESRVSAMWRTSPLTCWLCATVRRLCQSGNFQARVTTHQQGATQQATRLLSRDAITQPISWCHSRAVQRSLALQMHPMAEPLKGFSIAATVLLEQWRAMQLGLCQSQHGCHTLKGHLRGVLHGAQSGMGRSICHLPSDVHTV